MKYLLPLLFLCLLKTVSCAQFFDEDIQIRSVECLDSSAIITSWIRCDETGNIMLRHQGTLLDTITCPINTSRHDTLAIDGDLYKTLTFEVDFDPSLNDTIIVPLPCRDNCELSNLLIEPQDCIDEEAYILVDLDVGTGLSDSCVFTSDDIYFRETVAYADLPVVLGPIRRVDMVQGMLATDQLDNDCKAFDTFSTRCEPQECHDRFRLLRTWCDGYVSSISFELDCIDTTFHYNIQYGPYSDDFGGVATDTVLTIITGIFNAEPSDWFWQISYWSDEGGDTCTQAILPGLPCEGCDNLFSRADSISCNVDSTMSLTLDVGGARLQDYITVRTRDYQFLGTWPMWEFPVRIHGIEARPMERQVILMSINGDCGDNLEYDSPECVILPCPSQDFFITEFQCEGGNRQLGIAPVESLEDGLYDIYVDDVFHLSADASEFPVVTDPIPAEGQTVSIDIHLASMISQECRYPLAHRLSFCTVSTTHEDDSGGIRVFRDGDRLMIIYDSPLVGSHDFRLVSISGQVVQELRVPQGSTQAEMNMVHLPRGMYYLIGSSGQAMKVVY